MKKSLWIGTLIIITLIAIPGCTKKNAQQQVPQTGQSSAIEQTTTTPVTRETGFSGQVVNNVRVVKVKAFKFAFDPAEITVKKGDKVKIIAKSTDVTHGLSIPGYKINLTLPPNEEKTVEFTADKTGTFPYECSIYCGSGHENMRGKLIVKE